MSLNAPLAATQPRRVLLYLGAVLVPLAGLVFLPMAFGMAMTPTNRDDLVGDSNPYLPILFWVMVTAIVSIFAGTASADAATRSVTWSRVSATASIVAVTLSTLVIAVFAAGLLI